MPVFNEKFQKIKEEETKIKKEIKSRISGYVVGAFGLVAALAWNDAVKALIESFFPQTGGTITVKFAYAVIITVIVALIGVYVVQFFAEKESSDS